MEILTLLIVVGTSIWVWIDAKAIGAKKGQQEGLLDMGPFGWFLSCLLLWIICFPAYLVKRSEIKQLSSSRNPRARLEMAQTSVVSNLDELEKLGTLRERGIITEQEFQSQKAILLGGDSQDSYQSVSRSKQSDIPTTSQDLTKRPASPTKLEAEAESRRLLVQARDFALEGKTDLVVNVLRKIIVEYPNSSSAAQARRSLERNGLNIDQ